MQRITILILILLVLGTADAADLWVGTGQTHTDIKSAITASVNGDTVIVKDGTYTGPDNRDIDPAGKAITIKSENGPANCIIDCQSLGRAFYFRNSETLTTILDGFTITNGLADWDKGGGIRMGSGAYPKIQNCVIKNCVAYWNGGGIYSYPGANTNAQIINCLFINNSVTAASSDGGAACFTNNSPVIRNCTFVNNTAGRSGGALAFQSTSTAIISNCIFTQNNTSAITEIFQSQSDPQVQNCLFYNNPNGDFYDYDTTTTYTGAASLNSLAQFSGTLSDNPLFTIGSNGDYYLSQIASGQIADSPCIDTGSDLASTLGIDDMTTRTDGVFDLVIVDIGYHYTFSPIPTYDLTVSVIGSNGTVLPIGGNYQQDTIVELTASADTGYRVKQWSGTDNDSSTAKINHVTMTSNKTVTLEFESMPSIIYVDDDGPGDLLEDGSITYPFDSIQEAVSIVHNNGTVIVLDGTYDGQINFNGKNLILKSENGPQNCTIDCEWIDRAFCLENNESNDSVIQGFTILRGYNFDGGAIYLNNVSPIIKDCIFSGNQAYGTMTGGGAIHCLSSNPLINNCIFTKNSAYFGGAIQCLSNSSPIITNSVFIQNNVSNAGGGIYIKSSSPNIQNCRFTANKTDNIGGAIYSSSDSSYFVTNCTISDNTSVNDGGGIHCYDSSPMITNSIFTNNNNNAIYESHSSSDPNVTHCSFYDNPTGDYYDNDTSTSYTGAVNINTNIPQASNNIDSDPLYATDGYWGSNGEDDYWVDGDYHLKAQNGRWDPNTTQWIYDVVTSQCIDAGDTNSDWKKELWPHGKRINLGVYGGTNQASMSDSTIGSPADLDNNDSVDEQDLAFFVNSWLIDDALLPANITRNGTIDLTDFSIFAEDWGQFTE